MVLPDRWAFPAELSHSLSTWDSQAGSAVKSAVAITVAPSKSNDPSPDNGNLSNCNLQFLHRQSQIYCGRGKQAKSKMKQETMAPDTSSGPHFNQNWQKLIQEEFLHGATVVFCLYGWLQAS